MAGSTSGGRSPSVALGGPCGHPGVGARSECEREFDSTFALIQEAIFENRGCTSDPCHGARRFRRPRSARRRRLRQPDRAYRCSRYRSGHSRAAPRRARSEGPEPAVPQRRRRHPARRSGRRRCAPCRSAFPAFRPTSSRRCARGSRAARRARAPFPAPASCSTPACRRRSRSRSSRCRRRRAGAGVQIRMPRWIAARQAARPRSASPATTTSPTRCPTSSAARTARSATSTSQIRQDPLSHHLIVNLYAGADDADDPVWGTYQAAAAATRTARSATRPSSASAAPALSAAASR